MPIKFSNNYEAKKKRIKKLPRYMGDICMALLKKDADGLVKTFHDGIKNNTLDLEPLSQVTIDNKINSYPATPIPTSPLYGQGDNKKQSYANMLKIKKMKSGYKVYPSTAKHHKSKLPLNVMFAIHEYGCVVKVTPKMRNYLHSIGIHLKPTTMTITIPPRPAFLNAYNQVMEKRKKDKRETSRNVKKAINKFVNDANKSYIEKLIARYEKENV